MAQTVIFPKLGQTAEEGAIVKWHKKEGDKVSKGDILFEIETDKANLEVESFFEGTLIKILVQEGINVPVNTVVGYIGEPGEKVPETPPAPPAAPPESRKQEIPAPKAEEKPAAKPIAKPEQEESPAPTLEPQSFRTPEPKRPAAPARLVISPRARKLASDSAIDPARITGSGPNARIIEKDVVAYLEANDYADLRITPAAKRLAVDNDVDILSVRGSGDSGRIMVSDIEMAILRKPVAMSRLRQTIARRLVESKQTIPHFYVTVAVDMTDLLQLRADLKDDGLSYSVNDFILEAVVLTLEEFPVVNSTTNGIEVAWRGDVDLGVAVSVENGLLVPVIRAAQHLTMSELSQQVRAIAAKAREGKLTPDEMTGSSFTVSNMGMMDIESFQAIINPGEAAILAVASAKEQAVVKDGAVVVRSVMKMTLSADHRIVDGATAADFANAIRAKLEDSTLWRTLA